MQVNVSNNISTTIIQNALCSAFEGGSNYWYRIDEYVAPEKLEVRFDAKHVFKYLDYPLNPGGALVIFDKESGKSYTLSLKEIQSGIKAMLQKYPRHFADMVSENGDGITGDVFLQCCLFGDAIYG